MKKKYILYCIIALLLVAMFAWSNRPVDAYVTVESIHTAMQAQENYVLAKADDNYYAVNTSSDFSDLFQFESWESTSASPEGEPVLTFQLSELWIVAFYEDGLVKAHNGYAAIGKKSDACYKITEAVSAQLLDYLEQNGVPHEMGDGTISAATFSC